MYEFRAHNEWFYPRNKYCKLLILCIFGANYKQKSSMSEVIKIKKGLNIPLLGKAEKVFGQAQLPGLLPLSLLTFMVLHQRWSLRRVIRSK